MKFLIHSNWSYVHIEAEGKPGETICDVVSAKPEETIDGRFVFEKGTPLFRGMPVCWECLQKQDKRRFYIAKEEFHQKNPHANLLYRGESEEGLLRRFGREQGMPPADALRSLVPRSPAEEFEEEEYQENSSL